MLLEMASIQPFGGATGPPSADHRHIRILPSFCGGWHHNVPSVRGRPTALFVPSTRARLASRSLHVSRAGIARRFSFERRAADESPGGVGAVHERADEGLAGIVGGLAGGSRAHARVSPGCIHLVVLHIFSRKTVVLIDMETSDRAQLAAGHLPSAVSEPLARPHGSSLRGLGHVAVAEAADGGNMPSACPTRSLDAVRSFRLTPQWRSRPYTHAETCVEQRGVFTRG